MSPHLNPLDHNAHRRYAYLRTRNSGIGLESALVFAGEGAHVVVADINVEAANRAVEIIKTQVQDAPKAIAVKCDVSKEDDIKNLVATAVETFGRLDVMLCVTWHLPFSRRTSWASRPARVVLMRSRGPHSNNAGIMHPEDDNALNTSERIWDLTMNSSSAFVSFPLLLTSS